MSDQVFVGFQHQRIKAAGCDLNVITGGEGAALLLLHGFPQTHMAWHALAPLLADGYRLIVPDLPGYGTSRGPEIDPEHTNYAKKNLARIMAALVDELSMERFAIVAHDRGARVGFRMALELKDRVSALVSIDTLPTLAIWEAMDWRDALAAYHWPLLAQPAPLPETLLGNNADFYLDHLLTRWQGTAAQLAPAAVADYQKAFRNPDVIAAMCADYRAGATTDVDHDRADRAAGNKISAPVFVLCGAEYTKIPADKVRQAWAPWADRIQVAMLPCGHFVAEEQPAESASAIRSFLRQEGN